MLRYVIVTIIVLVAINLFHFVNGIKLKRLWLQDHCHNTVCSGVVIDEYDLVIMSQVTIPRQFSLTFRNSSIAKIPNLLFETFSDLQELHIENCSLKTFDRPQFEGGNNLNKLYLGHNQLKDVPKNIFSGANNLKILMLNNNRIRRLYNQSFSILKGLQELSLEGNQLHSLSNGVFSTLHQLVELNLAGNFLKFIHNDLFKENVKLTRINLAENILETFESKWFNAQSQLSLLNVSGNILPELNLNISYLKKFVAENCDIRQLTVHEGVIEEIHLRNNSLISIPYVLKAINVTNLDISQNPLRILEANDLNEFSGLLQLNLSATNLDNLPNDCFKSQTNLRILDVSSNSLYTLKFNTLHSLNSLKYFYFQYNNWNCDFLQLLMNSFVKRRDIAFIEDNNIPEVVDDYIDGLGCWYESSHTGNSARSDVSLEISLLRKDIAQFKDTIESIFRTIYQKLDVLKENI